MQWAFLQWITASAFYNNLCTHIIIDLKTIKLLHMVLFKVFKVFVQKSHYGNYLKFVTIKFTENEKALGDEQYYITTHCGILGIINIMVSLL